MRATACVPPMLAILLAGIITASGCLPISEAGLSTTYPDLSFTRGVIYTYGPLDMPAPNTPLPVADGPVEPPQSTDATETATPGMEAEPVVLPDGVQAYVPTDMDVQYALDIATAYAEQMETEVAELRRRIGTLEQNAGSTMNSLVSNLSRENQELRRELQRLYATGQTPSGLSAVMPEPVDAFQAQSFIPPIRAAAGPDVVVPQTETQNQNPLQQDITVILEWGHGPEEAKAMPAGMSAIKGMVCAVPKDMPEEKLIALGRMLKEQYGSYGRLNIEVFNDPLAAKHYIQDGGSPEPARVLAIQKNTNSGVDHIIRYEGSNARLIEQ